MPELLGIVQVQVSVGSFDVWGLTLEVTGAQTRCSPKRKPCAGASG